MTPDFIFMLTRADRTVEDAAVVLDEALKCGVSHIGFKDVGLPLDALAALSDRIRAAGATLYLEVVSLDSASEEASARAALRLQIDVLMGGTRPAIVLPIISGTKIRYFPFPGHVVGHPSLLVGTIDEIVSSAKALVGLEGVHGLDLLAYRFHGDVPQLIQRVCRAVGPKPVVVAGSLDSKERIAVALKGGAAAFTVGTAILDSRFPVLPFLANQLTYILELSNGESATPAASTLS